MTTNSNSSSSKDQRKVVLYLNASFDGYTSGPNGELDWLVPWASSDEAKQFLDEQMREMDTVLLGRSNYEGFSGYWPNVANDANAPEDVATYARWLDDVEKIVFSHSLTEVDWKNARLAHEGVTKEIAALRRRPGKNIGILSSTRLGHSMMEAGVVDELRINVLPVLLGSGRPLFAQSQVRTDLRLIEARPLPSGVLVLHYECKKP